MTMANAPAASEANTVSQEEEEVLGRVYTVGVDIGAMPVGDIALDNEPPIGPEIFSPQAPDRGTNNSSQTDSMPPLGSATAPTAAQASNTTPEQSQVTTENPPCNRKPHSNPKFRYANRKLLGTPEFFLTPESRGFFTERCELIGQVKACARASNDNRYRIEWKRTGVLPMPPSLNPVWLREWYPKEMEGL